MRFVVVTLALMFIAGMTYLTVADFAKNGVTGLGVVGAIVVGIVGIGVIGSFLEGPRRTDPSATARTEEDDPPGPEGQDS